MQSKRATLTLFPLSLVLYEIALYLSNDAYLPALPEITIDFTASMATVQWTLTLWFVGDCTMQLFLGPLSDRYGRRPILLFNGVVFVLSTIVCMMATQMHIFLGARFIQGATIPAISVAGYAVIHELFDQHKAIKTLAWMNSVTVLAPSFGPLLGGLLLYVMHWRWIFGLLAIWAIMALVLLWWIMPETLTQETQHPIQINRVLKQYASILRNAKFLNHTIIFCCVFGTMITWICVSPFLVISAFHYTLIEYGITQILIFGSFIIGARLTHFLISRWSLYKLLQWAIIIAVLSSLTMLLFSFLTPKSLVPTIIAMMLIAFPAGLIFPVLSRLAVEACTEPMGSRMALFSTLMSVFAIIGSMLASFVGTNLMGFSIAVFLLVIFSGVLFWQDKDLPKNPV